MWNYCEKYECKMKYRDVSVAIRIKFTNPQVFVLFFVAMLRNANRLKLKHVNGEFRLDRILNAYNIVTIIISSIRSLPALPSFPIENALR